MGFRFGRPLENLLRQATSITVTTGSAESGYGTDNLFNGNWANPFKQALTSPEEVDLDIVAGFASPVLPEFAVLGNSNLTVAAHLQGHTANSWGSPDIDEAFAVPTVSVDGFYSSPVLDLRGFTAKAWWRLHIAGNASRNVIGELFLGSALRELERSYLLADVSQDASAQTIVQATYEGVESGYPQDSRREAYSGSLIVGAADLAEVEGLVQAARFRARPFFCQPRSDVNDAWLVRYQADTLPRKPLIVDESTRVSFPIRQVSRGLPWADPDA